MDKEHYHHKQSLLSLQFISEIEKILLNRTEPFNICYESFPSINITLDSWTDRLVSFLRGFFRRLNKLMLLIMLLSQDDQWSIYAVIPSFIILRGFYFVIEIPWWIYIILNAHCSEIGCLLLSFVLIHDSQTKSLTLPSPLWMIHFTSSILLAVKLITKPDRRRFLQ